MRAQRDRRSNRTLVVQNRNVIAVGLPVNIGVDRPALRVEDERGVDRELRVSRGDFSISLESGAVFGDLLALPDRPTWRQPNHRPAPLSFLLAGRGRSPGDRTRDCRQYSSRAARTSTTKSSSLIVVAPRQFFRRANRRRLETRISTHFLDPTSQRSVGDVPAIPRQEIVHRMRRRGRNMQ